MQPIFSPQSKLMRLILLLNIIFWGIIAHASDDFYFRGFSVFPSSSLGKAITADGNFTVTDSWFSGGVSVAGGAFTASATALTTDDYSAVKFVIQVDPFDVGEQADLLVVFGEDTELPYDGGSGTTYFAITNEGDSSAFVDLYASAKVWITQLVDNPFYAHFTLQNEVPIEFGLTGSIPTMYYVFAGYRLRGSGKIVYSANPVMLQILYGEDLTTAESTLNKSESAPTPNQLPIADYYASPISGTAPLTVKFDADPSYDSDGYIVDYEWVINDEQRLSGKTVSTTFYETGDYYITLTVTDDEGAIDKITYTIKVNQPIPVNQSPIADYYAFPSSGTAPLTVKFDADPSYDSDGYIVNYEWVINDEQRLSGKTVSTTFYETGDYYITLTVTDDEGAIDKITGTIIVTQDEVIRPLPSTPVSVEMADVLTSSIWDDPTISVCWENPTSANEYYRNIVMNAVEGTWDRVSGVDFVGWDQCSSHSRGIRIAWGDYWPQTSDLDKQLDGVPNGMLLNYDWDGCPFSRDYCVRVIAVHEFGHALGFAHEQAREDTPSWCTEEQYGGEIDGDAYIGEWDEDSIMNYCNPKYNNDGNLSQTDILAVQMFYGPPDTTAESELVGKAYCRVLERSPDSGGLNVHLSLMLSGKLNTKQLVRALAISPEHQQRFYFGKSPVEYITTLYDHLLARSPDPEGLAYWVGKLSEDGWEDVIDGILNAPEYDQLFGFNQIPGDGREGCSTAASTQ